MVLTSSTNTYLFFLHALEFSPQHQLLTPSIRNGVFQSVAIHPTATNSNIAANASNCRPSPSKTALLAYTISISRPSLRFRTEQIRIEKEKSPLRYRKRAQTSKQCRMKKHRLEQVMPRYSRTNAQTLRKPKVHQQVRLPTEIRNRSKWRRYPPGKKLLEVGAMKRPTSQ